MLRRGAGSYQSTRNEIDERHEYGETRIVRPALSTSRPVNASNVIIATPYILKASVVDALRRLLEGCSILVADEAHHITAATWSQVRDHFAAKKLIQFTATPFRRDERKVDGKIIFNFKLGDAQESGYYRRINLRRVWRLADAAWAVLQKRDPQSIQIGLLPILAYGCA